MCLSVTDSGDELPVVQPPDPMRVGGLGLRIVDRIAATWGVSPFPGGKTVWATIARLLAVPRHGPSRAPAHSRSSWKKRRNQAKRRGIVRSTGSPNTNWLMLPKRS